jgi:5,6-dimethylbenzimidazole synthase
MTTPDHRYSDTDRAAIYRVIEERRDMRHFLPTPIADDVLQRLLQAAHHAPSVGFMQPWRFIRITNPALRRDMHALVEQERLQTARALQQREDDFMRIKVEGMMDCAEVLVAALSDKREQHVFGRRTLPEMDLASVSCAIQNVWLAARAEGLGLGWVSLFEPEALKNLLLMPADSKPVAILCIGHVQEFYSQPLLEQQNWATRLPLETLVYENNWDTPCR